MAPYKSCQIWKCLCVLEVYSSVYIVEHMVLLMPLFLELLPQTTKDAFTQAEVHTFISQKHLRLELEHINLNLQYEASLWQWHPYVSSLYLLNFIQLLQCMHILVSQSAGCLLQSFQGHSSSWCLKHFHYICHSFILSNAPGPLSELYFCMVGIKSHS